MRASGKILSLLTVGLWLAVGPSCAVAQDETAPAPSPPSAPGPPVAEPPPYPLELPDLHPPGNGAGLFPNGPRQNPPATTTGNSSRNHRNSLLTGTKRRGRSLDRTLQEADTAPLTVRIAYRRDKTTVLARNPELLALAEQADAARTDVQKRLLLREYYTRLFASIRRVDSSPEMKTHLALLMEVTAQRYDPKRRTVEGDEDLLNTRESSGTPRLGR